MGIANETFDTFTGSEVATALVEAVEAVEKIGPGATVVEVSAGEYMPVKLCIDTDYYGDGVSVWYVWHRGQLVVDTTQ